MTELTITGRWLFVKTCQELLQRSRSADYYDKLRMAGLLRHLLLGDRSLLRAALAESEPLDEELTFWFREPPEDPRDSSPTPDGFDASRREMAKGTVRRSDVEAFLAARIVHFEEWITVEQLIVAIAHAYGGFASDAPDGLSSEAFRALAAGVNAGAAGPVAVALQEITGVTLRALIPLANPSGETRPRVERSRPAPAQSAGGCPFGGKLPT